jgi:demethylmenaquinone methyltransferase/2-methoxy-6-polyprenyl-1,4-benzoquinol methylase
LVQADALALPFADSSFDVVTVAFGLRNMASWPGALREMARVLQPGGTLIILDFSLPEWEIFRNIYRFYLHRILPSIAGWATKRPAAYEYLGESIESFPSGLTMTAMMTSCGFSSEPPLPLTGGIVTLYSGKTKDD